MTLIHKVSTYYQVAYRTNHFPSSRRLLAGKQKVFAYYGFLGDGNFGDELVFDSARRLFRPHVLLPVRNRMPLHLAAFARFCRARFAGLVVGGGTLIGPLWNREFFVSLAEHRVPVYVHGTGVRNGIECEDGWKRILDGQFFGGVRGPLSVKNLSAIHQDAPVAGDAAFALRNTSLDPEPQSKRDSILINCGSHNSYAGEDHARNAIKSFIAEVYRKGVAVDFLPLHSIDLTIAEVLKRQFPTIRILGIPGSFEEASRHFRRARFAVGERLHFTAISIMSGCPFLSINYSDKHEDLLASLRLSAAGIRPEEVSGEHIVSVFERAPTFDWSAVSRRVGEFKTFQESQAAAFIAAAD
jgi:hypothetical protein